MIQQLKPRFQSFEDYLAYDDGSDKLYELFNGELVEVPPESGQNVQIANFLLVYFAAVVGFKRPRGHGLEIEVKGEPKNRYPDLTIIREEHVQLLQRRNTIRLTMPPPLLVVEVVSPGNLQWERDYIAKRNQYEDIEVPEYWIVNPENQTLQVLEMGTNGYSEVGNFTGNAAIPSPQFPELSLTAAQIFGAGGLSAER